MNWFRRSTDDHDQEIREHIEAETQANIERGMSPKDARRAAQISFGSVTGVRQALREGRRGYWIDTLLQDFRYSLRMLGRSPWISAIVVLTLSGGIGLTSAVFSIASQFAFAPRVSHDPDSFVQFVGEEVGFTEQTATVPRFEAFRRDNRSLSELAAWSIIPTSAQLGATDAARVQGIVVSCNYFSVFIEKPVVRGRFLQEDDCAQGQAVAVISDRLWSERFSEDPEIAGKTVTYGGKPITIVGVAVPPQAGEKPADIWLPYTVPFLKEISPFGREFDLLHTEDFYWLSMAGRLKPGLTRAEANAEFRILAGREVSRNPDSKVGVRLTDGSMWSMARTEALWMFLFVLAFPTLALVIVCATVATLLLSRAVGRQREMAVRLAMGGSKLRLIRLLLSENLVLSGLATILSLAIVYRLPAILVGFLAGKEIPGGSFTAPDWKVFAYMSVMAVVTAIFAGVSPALESLNIQLGETLKGRHVWGLHRGAPRLRNLLVAFQIALSMVPLVVAVTLALAERQLEDPGFETRQVVAAEIPQRLQGSNTQHFTELVEAVPGVRSVAYAESIPLVFEGGVVQLRSAEEGGQVFLSASVSPDYFRTLSIPIVSGRTFEAADVQRLSPGKPIVVSRQFASRMFPGQDPVGKIVESAVDGYKRYEIIGMVGNRTTGFGAMRAPSDGSLVYQMMDSPLKGNVLVLFDGDSRAFTRFLQASLKQSMGLVIPMSTIQSRLDGRLSGMHRFQNLVWILGLIVVALSLIGVFGVLSFNVAQHKKELAIRLALGALQADIFRRVALIGLRPVSIGLIGGVGLSFAALKSAENQRIVPLGLVSQDPLPYVAAGILLLFATTVAIFAPAYRAMFSDPVSALREE